MRIFKKNNRWYIDFRLNKKRIRKDFDTKEQAEFFYLWIIFFLNIQIRLK